MSVTIRKWSVLYPEDSYYLAPEIRPKVLAGKVYGHPKKADGTTVFTSPIVGASGRTVFTRSGTEYLLEDPDPDYVAELRKNGYQFDPENPIRVRRKRA